MVSAYYATIFASLIFWAQVGASFGDLRQDIRLLKIKAANNRENLRKHIHKFTGIRQDSISNHLRNHTLQTNVLLETNTDCTTAAVIENIGGIALETAEFVAGMLVILDDYVNGANSCFSINPFKYIPCFFKYTWNAIKNIGTTFSTVKNYISTMNELMSQISTVLSGNCASSSSTTSTTISS